jgi:hypothetical protein
MNKDGVFVLMLRPGWPPRCLTALAPLTPSPSAATARPTLISPSLTQVGIQIVPISTLPAAQYQPLKSSAIAESMAIANAREFAGGVDWNQPNSVEAMLVLYTNFHHGEKDTLAWIVTYKGVIYAAHGVAGSPLQTNTELNVVIDARTGKYLEAFSYR